jgi:hypothetical protein
MHHTTITPRRSITTAIDHRRPPPFTHLRPRLLQQRAVALHLLQGARQPHLASPALLLGLPPVVSQMIILTTNRVVGVRAASSHLLWRTL